MQALQTPVAGVSESLSQDGKFLEILVSYRYVFLSLHRMLLADSFLSFYVVPELD